MTNTGIEDEVQNAMQQLPQLVYKKEFLYLTTFGLR